MPHFLHCDLPHGYGCWIHWQKWLVFELLTAMCSSMTNITVKNKTKQVPQTNTINKPLHRIPSFTNFFAWHWECLSPYGSHQEIQDCHRSLGGVIQSKSEGRSLPKCFQIVLLFCLEKQNRCISVVTMYSFFLSIASHIYSAIVCWMPITITVSFVYMYQRSNPGHYTHKAYTLSELPPSPIYSPCSNNQSLTDP